MMLVAQWVICFVMFVCYHLCYWQNFCIISHYLYFISHSSCSRLNFLFSLSLYRAISHRNEENAKKTREMYKDNFRLVYLMAKKMVQCMSILCFSNELFYRRCGCRWWRGWDVHTLTYTPTLMHPNAIY